MVTAWPGGDIAKETNDAFATVYDAFNAEYQNGRWTATLLGRANAAGCQGNRLLDVACGTGLSFIPMLERGWCVTACDVSTEMLVKAQAKVGARADLKQADMRDLPVFGAFDLVWAINDPINYLLTEEELVAALAGMRANLASDGVLVFDVNTLTTYRTFFGREMVREHNGHRLVWKGLVRPHAVVPGVIAEADVEEIGNPSTAHRHRQRHFPVPDVLAAVEVAGLRCLEVIGEHDGELSNPVDEERHGKVVFVCKASSTAGASA